MNDRLPRRQFLQAASAMGLGAGLGPWEALRVITPASAEEARVNPEMVRFRPEIEPVVRWIEETPREQILEKAVAELKDGLSYRSLLSALFLAGIRNIKPRPVGFKFHAVMVINSAHLLGQIGRGHRAPAPALLGARQLQIVAGRGCPAKATGSLEPGRRIARAQASSGEGRLHPGDGGLGRRGGRRGHRRPLPGLGGGRDDGAALADGRPRPAQHRPQADLRRPELAHLAGDRLGARRARAPLADVRPARPPGRPAQAARSLRGQPGKRRARFATTGRSAEPTREPPRLCSRRSARPRPRPPRPRPSRCSIRALRRARSGTP